MKLPDHATPLKLSPGQWVKLGCPDGYTIFMYRLLFDPDVFDIACVRGNDRFQETTERWSDLCRLGALGVLYECWKQHGGEL